MAIKTYGTVSAERQKQMTGLEFVHGLASGALPLNTIAQRTGALSLRSRRPARISTRPAPCTAV
jgi:hypothetical protein